MDDVLNATLHTGVEKQLDYIDGLVARADDPSKTKLADSVIPQLTHAWRELLAVHAPDEHGRCPECSPRKRFWFRRPQCTVWRTAQLNLLCEPGEVARVGRHRLRGQRQATC